MRSALIALAALFAALPLAAKDVTAKADVKAKSRPFYTDRFLRVGYAADPAVGGEEAARRCRRAGAWSFRTSKCDDATLAFCQTYALRIVLLPDGDLKTCVADLTRIANGPYASVLAGVQLGSDPTGGSEVDLAKWRTVLNLLRRRLPKVPVALPVRDEKSELIVKMAGTAGVTHLLVDLTDTPAPYARLNAISRALRGASGKQLQGLKLWAVAPGAAKKATGARELAWQMHWIFSAFAVERTDGVFFAREYKADDFGLMMRHFWATAAVHPYLTGHGEGTFAETKPPKTGAAAADLDLESADSLDLEQLEDAVADGFAPQACAKVAEGRAGDLEYLVFSDASPAVEGSSQMCLAVVNTTGEQVELGVKLVSKTGDVGTGYRRRLVPDPKTGGFSNSTRPRWGKTETVAPGEITFMDFNVK